MNGYQRQLRTFKRYRRSPKGILTRSYITQKWNSRKRKWKLPTYSLKELHSRFLKDKKFIKIYNYWFKNGRKSKDRPSIDRIDVNRGYTMKNIQVMTWEDNYKKSLKERTYPHRHEVYMYSIRGKKLKKFYSITEAAKTMGVGMGNISTVCKGNRPTCGGYVWKFGKRIINKRQIHGPQINFIDR